MIHAVIGAQSAEAYRLAARAGYTHAIVIVDPFDSAVEEQLEAAGGAGLKIVLRPSQWVRGPDVCVGQRVIPEAWLLRNALGEAPPPPYEINTMPSPWIDEPWNVMVRGLRQAQQFCKGRYAVDGVYVGCCGELGFPRQFTESPLRSGRTHRDAAWLYCHDPAARLAYRQEFGQDAPATLNVDVRYHGARCLDWMYRSLVDRLERVATAVHLRPWLPIIATGLRYIGDEACTKMLIEYHRRTRWHASAVWLVCALYGSHDDPAPADRVADMVLRKDWLGLPTVLVGSEGVKGALAGCGRRALRDRFSGLLTNPRGISEAQVGPLQELLVGFDQ